MRNFTIEDCKEYAKIKDGECLSDIYKSKTKIKWKCKCGYIWESDFLQLKKNSSWCKKCAIVNIANKNKNTINDVQKLAEQNNGKCLSTEYVNATEKLKFQCEHGHIWETCYITVKQGSWCPTCAKDKFSKNKRGKPKVNRCIDINLCYQLAKQKNGECLSAECNNCNDVIKWKCHNDHIWESKYKNIASGSWCPKCGKTTIEDCQKLAKEKGGECLSETYENRKKLKWKCQYEHIWESRFDGIKAGHWCPNCAKNKITIEDCKELASKNNGKCLSTECNGSDDTLLWKCSSEHTWKNTYYHIKQGQWCPQCVDYKKNENICKDILETIFEKQFKKVRPDWLKNPDSGCNLEIDLYNEELNIACEYNGRQHYLYSSFFHKTEEEFKLQQKRDEIKFNLIKNKNVYLIVIPYHVKRWRLLDYIIKECKINQINIKKYLTTDKYDKLKEKYSL